MNGHLKKALLLLALLSASACATTTPTGSFTNADFSAGSSTYGVYVPSQGRSIFSSLSF